MPAKPNPPVPAEPTPEEARAAKLARLEQHRNRRPRHSASNPLRYDVSCCPPVGPTYDVSNIPAAAGPDPDFEVVHVSN